MASFIQSGALLVLAISATCMAQVVADEEFDTSEVSVLQKDVKVHRAPTGREVISMDMHKKIAIIPTAAPVATAGLASTTTPIATIVAIVPVDTGLLDKPSFWFILAGCGVLHEIWLIKKSTDRIGDHDKDRQSREPLWDIAKFFLMILVWFFHAGTLGSELYSGWFMPAFFFLSGLTNLPVKVDRLWIRKLTINVLRDHVLNVALFQILVYIFCRIHASTSFYRIHSFWDLWFLHALCTCRIGIPLCFCLTRRVGERSGSIMLVAVAFILPYMLAAKITKVGEVAWRVMTSWIFYSFGFLTDPCWFASQIKNPAATLTSAALVVMFLLSTFTVGYETRYGNWQEYLRDTLAKELYVVLFLACLAPVACIGRIIPQVLAKFGQRTLQAYMINVFLWAMGFSGLALNLSDPDLPRAVVISHDMLCILATSMACSTLSEWCFGWVVSPQWILDAGSKARLYLDAGSKASLDLYLDAGFTAPDFVAWSMPAAGG